MVVDIHAHIIVPEITRETAPEESWRPSVTWQDGQQFVEFGGRRINSALREFVNVDQILAAQERSGVDFTLLSPWSSLFRYETPVEDCLRACQIQNDALARLAGQRPDRLAAIGTVPMQDADAAVAELRRCMTGPGLLGVEIGSNVNGVYLGDARFRPFWAAVEELDAFVEIHPVSGVGGPAVREYYLWNAWANPAETALTAAHIILSGLLEEHPDLKVCLLHGGGHLPYQIGRLDRAWQVRPEARKHLSQPPGDLLRKFYFDTVTHSAAALRYLIDVVGAAQVMLGSDYPFDMGSERPAEVVQAVSGLSAAHRGAILGQNARDVLKF